MRISDWSSDVCSSDLRKAERRRGGLAFKGGDRSDASPYLRFRAHQVDARGQSDAQPVGDQPRDFGLRPGIMRRSEEHTSELQSLMRISYAVFCLKKKTKTHQTQAENTLQTPEQVRR